MEQTNHTILFECVNPEAPDLLTLIGDNDEKISLDDASIKRIHDELDIESFEDFTKKFCPHINLLLETSQNIMIFSDDNLGKRQKVIELFGEKSCFEMIRRLIEEKQNGRYVLTNFEDFGDSFFEFAEKKNNFYEERAKIIGSYSYFGQKRKTELTDKVLQSRRKRLREIIADVADGVFLLNVFIDNVRKLAQNAECGAYSNRGITDDYGIMQVKVIRKGSGYLHNCVTDTNYDDKAYSDACLNVINEYYDNNPDVADNRKLMADCFLLPVYVKNDNWNYIFEQYKRYSSMYMELCKKFWAHSRPLIEIMLGVWTFFDTYGDIDGMRPRLLVTNIRPGDLQNINMRKALELYLSSVNLKNYYDKAIWYAIIPNVSDGASTVKAARERFVTNRDQIEYSRNDFKDVSLLLDILSEFKIQSFVSLALLKENSYTYLCGNGITETGIQFSKFDHIGNGDYLVPSFPNFTVITDKEACLYLGRSIEYDEFENRMEWGKEQYLWLNEVGIEASYIAAGIFAACQCPKYLNKHYKRGVCEEIPGVAYRFSKRDNYAKTPTNMFSNTIIRSSEAVKEAVNRSRGVMLGEVDGNVVVMTDRVFSYSNMNRVFVSTIQLITYAERVIRYDSQDFKKKLIFSFFQRRPNSKMAMWFDYGHYPVNALFDEKDMFEYSLDEKEENCIFSFSFADSELVRKEKVSMFTD